MSPLSDEPSPRPPLDPILDTAPCGFLRLDDAGMVVAVNATLADLLGRDRDEIEGRHIDALLSGAGRIFHSTHLFPLLRLHGRAEELYTPILHADGTEIPMLVNGRARDQDGRTVYDLVLVPMRQRNELESELIAARNSAIEAAATKDRFLSIVSHELRSPLAGITGYAELLLRGRKGPLTDDQRRYVERIRDAGQYQAGLIEDILDFAAIGEGRELSRLSVPVEQILARAEAMLALRVQEAGRKLVRTPKPASGAVLADGRATQQILLNLGMNALKYGLEGPIEITVSEHDATTSISVRDEGEGIAPDQLDRIFDPFVQLPVSDGTETKRKGVGLGLAISRDLARAMHGDLTVVSEPGRGSTFTLRLPSG